MEIYFENSLAQVIYDGSVPCVCISIQGFLLSDEYREIMDKALELMKIKKTGNLLGDLSTSSLIAEEDQEWTNNEWAKRAVSEGFRYNAIIISKDIFTQMSINEIVEKKTVVEVRYFDNESSAKTWLSSV
jgi:hypothetical protein